MKIQQSLINQILKNAANFEILEVEAWPVKKNNKPMKMYTITDNLGSYALTRLNDVYFTEKNNAQRLLKENLDEFCGKPKSISKELAVYKIKNKFGIYDDNMKMIYGPFNNFNDVKNYIEEENLDLKNFVA